MSSFRQSPEIADAFAAFPLEIRKSLLVMRDVILSTGEKIGDIGTVQETIKWGQPSYTTISGSTVRLGHTSKHPETYSVYFHCQTQLVSTFRKLYPDHFHFEGNREIRFAVGESIPRKELSDCIMIALTYHRRKQLPNLGAQIETPNQ